MPGYGINLIAGKTLYTPSSSRLVLLDWSGNFIQLFYTEPTINYCGGTLLQGFTGFSREEMKAWKASIREAIEWYVSRYKPGILYYLFLTFQQNLWIAFFREFGWYFSNQFVNPNTGNKIHLITNLNLYSNEINRTP